ncbi:hypothetical protein MJO28_001012, partial [Puccinia striiformis f. sp. tritici]
MVFVRYEPQVKAIVVRWMVRGRERADINAELGFTIHKKTMDRWLRLYESTRSVVRDPLTYRDRGRPLAISSEAREFLLDVLQHKPTLYLDELQVHLEAMTGVHHPISTIHDDLRSRLQLSRKVAMTVHPGQSAIRRANYIYEAGVSQDTHRRKIGWSRRGFHTCRIYRRHDAMRVNVLPAVSLDGILCSIAQPGSITRLDMEYFVEQVL